MHGTSYIHLAQKSRKGGTLAAQALICAFLLGFPQLKFHLPTCVLRVNNCRLFFDLSVILVLFGRESLSVTSGDSDLATGHRPG